MSKDLPLNMPSLVQGLGYFTPPELTTDACSTEGADQFEVLGAPNSMSAPCVVKSLATEKDDAPKNGHYWNSGDKGENWMEKDSY